MVALLLVVVTGGKAYYAIGTTPVFMAAGAILLDRWLTSGHEPILPIATYATTTLPADVPDTANQIGWPQFVATVEGVIAALPADERARTVILTNSYSEASPLILLARGWRRSTRGTTGTRSADPRRPIARSWSMWATGGRPTTTIFSSAAA